LTTGGVRPTAEITSMGKKKTTVADNLMDHKKGYVLKVSIRFFLKTDKWNKHAIFICTIDHFRFMMLSATSTKLISLI
jgi:hypothetical protein